MLCRKGLLTTLTIPHELDLPPASTVFQKIAATKNGKTRQLIKDDDDSDEKDDAKEDDDDDDDEDKKEEEKE